MGILFCQGFLFDSLENRFELRFPYPEGFCNPRSLLDILCGPINREKGVIHALNQRIDLVKSIVTAVFLLHAADLVHKQIQPDNIIIFQRQPKQLADTINKEHATPENMENTYSYRQTYPHCLGRPFLVGSDCVRKADAGSLMLKTEDWKKNIYLSPVMSSAYSMQHDMYTLGVVLLEIAWWASFSDRHLDHLGKMVWRDRNTLLAPEELKKMYMSLAVRRVPRLMGQKYANVVAACLGGLEEERQKGELADADGIVVGTAYVTKVIRQLEEISI